jgi:hypothetical protein
MTCEELHVEMAKVRQEMRLKPTKIQIRNGRNNELAITGGVMGAGAGVGVAAITSSAWAGASGYLFTWPWGEMDWLQAEEIELKALHARYNNLFMIAVNKGCPLGNNTITVKRKGGRNVTLDDVLEDDLPSGIGLMATSRP